MLTDRRRETRFASSIHAQVWGTDAHGDPFSEDAAVTDISESGALLSGLKHQPRCGDLIGVAWDGHRARFRAVWVRHSDGEELVQIAVHKLTQDACPWRCLLPESARHRGSQDRSLAVPHLCES